jgi:hypothetical protein
VYHFWQALKKGAATGADLVAAMATDEPEADTAAAEPMDDDASDADDPAAAVQSSNGGGGKPGKKRVSEEFRQKVSHALPYVHSRELPFKYRDEGILY